MEKIIKRLKAIENSLVGKIIIVIIPTIIFYIGLDKTMIKKFIIHHEIFIATIIFMLLVISFWSIYEILENKIIKLKSIIAKIIKIESIKRDLADKTLKHQIDYNRECLSSHISGNDIPEYHIFETDEMKNLRQILLNEIKADKK